MQTSRAACRPLRSIFDLDGRREQIKLLELQSLSPGFWDDQDKAAAVQQQLGQLQDMVGAWDKNYGDLEDAELLLDMAVEEQDEASLQELVSSLDGLRERVDMVELDCMFTGEHDAINGLFPRQINNQKNIFTIPTGCFITANTKSR